MMTHKITGIILCGGQSRRMGQDKGLFQFQGHEMVKYAIQLFEELGYEIVLSASSDSYDKFGYPVIKDLYLDAGPLAGIHAAMRFYDTTWSAVIPCDYPLVEMEVFQKLYDHLEDDHIITAIQEDKWHPLIGFYPSSLWGELDEKLKIKELKVMDFIEGNAHKNISFNTTFQDQFLNFNSPQDISTWKLK